MTKAQKRFELIKEYAPFVYAAAILRYAILRDDISDTNQGISECVDLAKGLADEVMKHWPEEEEYRLLTTEEYDLLKKKALGRLRE